MKRLNLLFLLGLGCLPTLACAQETQAISAGDSAWVLTSTALVLLMTIPGLALFYAGLVRERNVLSVLMHCFAITALTSVLWVAFGYTMAFSQEGMSEGVRGWNAFVGSFDKLFLLGVTATTPWGSIPEPLFCAFQMTFFIITPALIVGAFVERIKFSAMLWFVALWNLLVYLPVCHMVWGGKGAFFADLGVFDFAGGIVVHITAGMAAIVSCIMVGPRRDYPKSQILPHNLPMTVTGTGLLWVGWYGFNGGSALAANGSAAMAILVTHTSASVAALTWMLIEWMRGGKPSMLGLATGSIAGLAAITPASGYVGPLGAAIIGLLSGVVCWWMCAAVKTRYKYDDSLDVFGVHGIGGFLGTILVGIFASPKFGGNQADLDILHQLGVQSFAAVSVGLYTFAVSVLILKGLRATIGLRVNEQHEIGGLDLNTHGESGYNAL
ncbi:MAG: ammonium transporter [Opitutales bacterium]|nr:ammonium transporter [Opitutales bacterium]